jgi:enoyl-CoA hydratase/carnithine racemase
MARLESVRKPVIAQVEGFAVGGGFRIATACDLRIATPDARFGAPIARTLGNCLSMAAYASLVDAFGPSRLKDLIFTARLLTAPEAHAAGYVQEIVSPEEIAGRVTALAHQIAEHAPITLRVTKESLRRLAASRTLPDDEDLIAATYTSADFREGVRAFLDKRKPRWSGR